MKYTDVNKRPAVTVTTGTAEDEMGERMIAAMERIGDMLADLRLMAWILFPLGVVTILIYLIRGLM